MKMTYRYIEPEDIHIGSVVDEIEQLLKERDLVSYFFDKGEQQSKPKRVAPATNEQLDEAINALAQRVFLHMVSDVPLLRLVEQWGDRKEMVRSYLKKMADDDKVEGDCDVIGNARSHTMLYRKVIAMAPDPRTSVATVDADAENVYVAAMALAIGRIDIQIRELMTEQPVKGVNTVFVPMVEAIDDGWRKQNINNGVFTYKPLSPV